MKSAKTQLKQQIAENHDDDDEPTDGVTDDSTVISAKPTQNDDEQNQMTEMLKKHEKEREDLFEMINYWKAIAKNKEAESKLASDNQNLREQIKKQKLKSLNKMCRKH